MASMETVERASRWMHEEYGRHAGAKGRPFTAWEKLCEDDRDGYRTVARALLLRPPGWLRKAMSS